MKNITSIMLLSSLGAGTVSTMNAQEKSLKVTPDLKGNPFLTKSPLQYQAPQFDKIKTEHFKPAFEYGLKVHEAEIEKIANNKKQPTFENTVLALEKSGEVLKRAQTIFYNLMGSMSNPEMQKIQKEFAPIFSAHTDKIHLNSKLYERIKKVPVANLDAESRRLVEYYRQVFELSGANLSDAKKEELKSINSQLAGLSTEFSAKLLEARKNNGLLVENVKELDGLTADQIKAAADAAKSIGKDGKYLIVLHNTTQHPLLPSLHNRATREKLFKASWTRPNGKNT